MTRRKKDRRSFEKGEGVTISVPVEPNEMYSAGRLYAHITLAPGAKMDLHIHRDEMESYYILKGTARVRDNDRTEKLTEGDTLITKANDWHAIYNDTDEPVEFMALIISKVQGEDGASHLRQY